MHLPRCSFHPSTTNHREVKMPPIYSGNEAKPYYEAKEALRRNPSDPTLQDAYQRAKEALNKRLKASGQAEVSD